jgi:hypothetical protein
MEGDPVTLTNEMVDGFTQGVHRRVGELMRAADPTVEEVNRLLFLVTVMENQATDLRRAVRRREARLAQQ